MAFDATKVLASRDYKVYTVNWSSTNTIPLDTVAYGTAWGTPAGQSAAYVESGYVDGGLHFTTSIDRAEIRVDQELDPVLRPATGRDTRMSTNLAEITAANIRSATGQGTITTVAAISGTRGHDDWDLNSTVLSLYLTVGFDILHPGDAEAFRMIGWKGQVLGSPTFDVTPEDKFVIPLELALLPDTSTSPARIMKIRDIIAALP
jgi:hypothetical protein